MGKKRTNSGKIKAQSEPQHASEPLSSTQPTPPEGQPQLLSDAKNESQNIPEDKPESPEREISPTHDRNSQNTPQPQPSKAHHSNRKKRQKLSRLPKNATVTKRPLLHPAIPTPFTSSESPKVLYITASTPYIPCVKRIRKLLSLIEQRWKQSQAAQSKKQSRSHDKANGRLAAIDIERDIVEGVANTKRGNNDREKVYLKATGRAIPRALELGVHFQAEEDCCVRVEMGNVRAIDDVDVPDGGEGDDIPETRLRTLSSVTVSIGVK